VSAKRSLSRAIIVAHTANPHTTGSVPMIGYRIASGLGELTDANFIFHARHRADLERYFPPDRVIYAGSRRLATALRRVSERLFPERWGPTSIIELLDYIVFDIDSYRKARRLVRRGSVDFVLRVNPISFRFASILPRLPVPVFTGPHNGGMRWPPAFTYLDREEKTAEGMRFLGDLMHRVYRDTPRYTGIFVAHELCAQTVGEDYQDKVIFTSENAVERLGEVSPWAGDAHRLLYVGRMIPFKVIDLILRGLARLPDSVHLTLVGDGPQRPELESLAAKLGVADRCNFVGVKPHKDLHQYYTDAGVFVFPSVRESGGMVVLEAMSHGLPCLVANWGGPPIYTSDTGIHLSVESPQALEDALVTTISHMLENPEEGRRVGELSRQAIDGQYIWSRKSSLLLEEIRERLPQNKSYSEAHYALPWRRTGRGDP
jgi:glycosyltransferase involved in cell wall biosynthesis